MIFGLPFDTKNIPNESGCYILYDEKKEVLYVGKAKNLHQRIVQHLPSDGRYPWGKRQPSLWIDSNIDKVKFIETIKSPHERTKELEIILIKMFHPEFNLIKRSVIE